MTKSLANGFSVALLAASTLLAVVDAREVSADEGDAKESPAPVCRPVQLESGWFEERNSECVADMEAALNDLKRNLDEQRKLFSGKSVEDFTAEAEASKQAAQESGAVFDTCVGPAILDGSCGVSCNDCMCCAYC